MNKREYLSTLTHYLNTGIVIILILLASINTVFAQSNMIVLSNDAQISLLTVDPSDDEVYTVYGHTALRVNDIRSKIDIIFNYGVFDFSKPNFIYRFTKGETDYCLAAYKFQYFIAEYTMRGSKVTEQILNLSQTEKQKIWEALLINNRPENRTYRYNFFYDNCATRPLAIIEKFVKINYKEKDSEYSFRDLINYCTRNHSWLTFGCDLALGSPTDQPINAHEEMFLPELLRKAFDEATKINSEGKSEALVSKVTVLTDGISEEEDTSNEILTPLFCCWLFFIIVLIVTAIEWKKKKHFKYFDFALFLIAGLAGVLMYFLCFISTHPCIWPNWQIIWLHPFHLIGCILFILKKCRKAANFYHFINFAALTLMLAGWIFIPQHLNLAFIPLIMSLWTRSLWSIYNYIWKRK